MKFYIWLDDIRDSPYTKNTLHTHSVNETINVIISKEKEGYNEFELNLDHDLGDYYKDGGDGYKLILWLIETERNNFNYNIKLHTQNVVGRENMSALVKRYWH